MKLVNVTHTKRTVESNRMIKNTEYYVREEYEDGAVRKYRTFDRDTVKQAYKKLEE